MTIVRGWLIAAVVAFAVPFSAAAGSLGAEELQAVVRLNPSLGFAKWAIKQPIDESYAAVTFQEVGDQSDSERAGRKYALTIFHLPSKKVLLMLEQGTLELGINPHPVTTSKGRVVFGFGTDYFDQRRIEYTFSLNPPRVLSSKEVEAPPPDPNMP
jgi:hypothetical protein